MLKTNYLETDVPVLQVGHSVQLIGAVYSGIDCTYLIPFPSEDPKDFEREFRILSMDAGAFAIFLDQSDNLNVQTWTKAILRKSQRQVDAAISWNVFRRDGYACRYCGANDVPLTVDHVRPWESGGATVESNLVAADRKCNRLKGSMSYADWLESIDYKVRSRRLTLEQLQANRDLLESTRELPQLKTRSR